MEYCSAGWIGQGRKHVGKSVPPHHAGMEASVLLARGSGTVEDRIARFEGEVRARFGVLPSFFRASPDSIAAAETLWAQARSAYLDNPAPSSFKERLFAYLSRFCANPYCLARHLAFLRGRGRPAGDPSAGTMSSSDVLALLAEPVPSAAAIERALAVLEAGALPAGDWPPAGSPLLSAIHAAAVVVFLDRNDAARCRDVLARVLGAARYDALLLLLAFVRTAHLWAEAHPDLAFEADVVELLAAEPELDQWVRGYRTVVALELGEKPAALATEHAELQAAYETVLAAARDAVVSIDAEGCVRLFNRAAQEMFGYEEAEVLGRNVSLLMPAPYRDEHDDYIHRYRATGVAKAIGQIRHVRARRKDGEEFPIELSVWEAGVGEGARYTAIVRDVSDRERAAEQLERSRILRHEILDSLLLHVAVLDAAGVVREANLAWTRHAEEVGGPSIAGTEIGADFVEICRRAATSGDADAEAVLRGIESVVEGASDSFEYEYCAPTPSGGRHFWMAVVRHLDCDGGAVISQRDVTESRRVREQLEDNEERLRRVLSLGGIGVVRDDLATGRVELDARAARLAGLPPEPTTWPVDELFAHAVQPGDLQALRDLRARAIESGEPVSLDVRVRNPSVQDEEWHRIQLGLVRDAQGRPHHLVGAVMGVTDQKRREAELEAHVAQWESVADVGLAAVDGSIGDLLDHAVVVAAKTLGVEYAKILELVPGGDALLLRAGVGWKEGLVGRARLGTERASQAGFTLASAEPVVVHDLRTETRFHGPSLLVDHDVVAGMSVVIHTADGPFGVFGVHTTCERRFTREDVAFLQAVANIVSTALDRDRVSKQLEDARRKAALRERLADVGALAAKIVHDIGNPLAGLSMSAQNVQRRLERGTDLTEEAIGRPIDRILKTVRRLDGLVSEFKQFLRHQDLDLQDVEIPALLGEIVDFWKEEAGAREIQLVMDPVVDLPAIKADPQQIRRILDNLVKNALEAIDAGPGEVRLKAELLDPEKIRLSVDDSGPGVPDGIDVFALFETTKREGTGLGLPIVRQIATAHGGGLEFARLEPHGTRFVLDLPVRGPLSV